MGSGMHYRKVSYYQRGIQAMPQLTDQHIATVMQAYVDAMSGDDVDKVLELYAEDAVVEDPIGSKPFVGIDAIRGFYTESITAVARMELEGNPRVRGNHGVCAMLAYPKGAEDTMLIETLDVMVFDDNGKVSRMTAYWGDRNIRIL
jgi:steroid delta-isomerase